MPAAGRVFAPSLQLAFLYWLRTYGACTGPTKLPFNHSRLFPPIIPPPPIGHYDSTALPWCVFSGKSSHGVHGWTPNSPRPLVQHHPHILPVPPLLPPLLPASSSWEFFGVFSSSLLPTTLACGGGGDRGGEAGAGKVSWTFSARDSTRPRRLLGAAGASAACCRSLWQRRRGSGCGSRYAREHPLVVGADERPCGHSCSSVEVIYT